MAYAYCERLAREHYENFPVASRLLPAPCVRISPRSTRSRAGPTTSPTNRRPPTPGAAPAARRLGRAARPAGSTPTGRQSGDSAGDDLDFPARSSTRSASTTCPVALSTIFSARSGRTSSTTRYATWDDVLDYCRRSANPVGRLVLRVAGYDDPRLDAQSDAVCTALQLTNFWQDLAIDWARGRLYVPLEDRDRAGATRRRSRRGAHDAGVADARFGSVRARTRALFDDGRPVCDGVARPPALGAAR